MGQQLPYHHDMRGLALSEIIQIYHRHGGRVNSQDLQLFILLHF
jgi:hypothetical protein